MERTDSKPFRFPGPLEGPTVRVFALRGSFERPPLLGPWPENRFRGVLGHCLRRIACAIPDQFAAQGGCNACLGRSECAYSLLFYGNYPANAPRLKRHAQVPRPYVIDLAFETETKFIIWLTVVGDHLATVPHLVLALQEAGRVGVGAGRDTFVIRDLASIRPFDHLVQELPLSLLEPASVREVPPFDLHVLASSLGQDFTCSAVRITLTKPAIIRDANRRSPLSPPVFVARLLERISLLTLAYCPGRSLPPFQELRDQTTQLEYLIPHLITVDLRRFSRRQKRELELEAILGQTEWRGNLSQLYPYLVLGQWLHVGKGTAFGLGRYEVTRL